MTRVTRDEALAFASANGHSTAATFELIALARRFEVPEALGLTLPEYVQQHLGGYVRLPVDERQKAVAQLTAPVEDGGHGLSTRAAADVLGVGVATVHRDRVPNGTAEPQTLFEPAPSSVPNGTAERPRLRKVRALAELTGTWPVIYADPPWRYEGASTPSRAIENHYPTMALADICALPVSDKATAKAVLFLWTPAPKVFEACSVVQAWGFDYRTCMVWDKVRIGMGNYGRGRHELLFIANRGGMPTPETDELLDSVIASPRTEHSRKPDVFYEVIERLYPDVPYLELFARRQRSGWDVWGDEAPTAGELAV